MCGILFCVYNNYNFDCLKHRGPDHTDCQHINNFWFCHHRLTIIDLGKNKGNQPIVRNGIVLICNGEIYNYKNFETPGVTSVDCDVIIDIYLQHGVKGFRQLDGDFAFVLYDQKKNIIISARDPVGLKPLFIGYNKQQQIVSMASEMKALSCDETIKRHPIAKALTIDAKSLKVKDTTRLFCYSSCLKLIGPVSTPRLLQRVIDNICYLITDAVKKRIEHTHRPYALLCSGGVDSAIILAITVKLLGVENVHVFTMVYDDNSTSYDGLHADMLVSSLGPRLKHTKVLFTKEQGLKSIEKVIYHLESYDPNTIRASVPMFLLAQHIKENTDYKVILSGEGADELFLGYNYFGICDPTSEQAVKESIRLVKNMHSFDLLRAERCFAAHGLELRVPFLDKDVLNFVLRIPGHLRLPFDRKEKWLLRESFKHLDLPDRILNREKERFSDGVSHNWVPTLIRFACDQKTSTSQENLKKERKYYLKVYQKMFKHKTIIKRKMPVWGVTGHENKKMI